MRPSLRRERLSWCRKVVNAYPELPSLPYFPTSVPMAEVIGALAALPVANEIKRSAYVMFRNESGNGKSGINNNYVGAQADSGRWPDKLTHLFYGVVAKRENRTGKDRLFLAFRDVGDCLSFLCDRVQNRGLYVGGATSKVVKMAVPDAATLARAYHKEWVSGSAASEPGADEVAAFLSMYRQAAGYFPAKEAA